MLTGGKDLFPGFLLHIYELGTHQLLIDIIVSFERTPIECCANICTTRRERIITFAIRSHSLSLHGQGECLSCITLMQYSKIN